MVVQEVLTGEPAAISVWLDNSRTDVLKNFHCLGCGSVLFQYYDSVRIVVPGNVDDGKGTPRLIKCRGRFNAMNKKSQSFNATCKIIYRLN